MQRDSSASSQQPLFGASQKYPTPMLAQSALVRQRGTAHDGGRPQRTSPSALARQRHWWSYAGLALLGFCLLLFLLAGTAEALAPRGFGEVGMLFVLPLEGFPILLIISGIVRIVRGERET